MIMRRRAYACVLLLLLVMPACKTSTGGSAPGPGELTIEKDLVFGPGSFSFADTRAGLADLSSYTATLTLSFDGRRDGKPESWSLTYVMRATREPLARQWTIGADQAVSRTLFEMDGTAFDRIGEGECTSAPISEGAAPELASFLTGVIGAEEAGTETVNDIAADHYTFDQRALGEDGLSESSGELWVASDGGYIVRYLLTTKADEDYFGGGAAGTLKLDYRLGEVNVQTDIVLPDDCPPGLVDAPMLADATDSRNADGVLAYSTPSTIADVIAFYQKELPALGWTAQNDPAGDETVMTLTYTRDDQFMDIVVAAGDAHTEVQVIVSKMQEATFP